MSLGARPCKCKLCHFKLCQKKSATPVKEPVLCDRFSLDLEEDLQYLLEERAPPHQGSSAQRGRNIGEGENLEAKVFEMENDENKPININFSTGYDNSMKNTPNNFSTRAYYDETSDDSFIALEKMCEKTASDPDSTLFKYIHSENKEMVLEDLKKRIADGNYFGTPSKQARTPIKISSRKRTPLSSARKNNRFLVHIKPVPKLELFKK